MHPIRRKIVLSGTAAMLLFGINKSSLGQQKSNNETRYKIGISTGSFVPDGKVDWSSVQTPSFLGNYFAIIQFYEIPSESQRESWASKGLSLTDYLPGKAYFAVIDEKFPVSIISTQVRAVIPIDKRFKMEASLLESGIPKHARDKSGKARMILSYHAGLSTSAIQKDLEEQGVQIVAHRDYSRQFDVLMEASALDKITALPYIQFIGAFSGEPIIETEDHNNSSGRSNYLNTGFGGLNYNGSGMVIGVGEDGTVDSLIDVKGRLTELIVGTVSSHKVGVMNYMAGGGNSDPIDRNNAWGANVMSIAAFPDYSGLYSSANLRFTNHSYGFPIGGGYDLNARNHDLRTASLPNHLVIYSAGNSGTALGYGPYNLVGWANITGATKHNKTQFAVGALTPTDAITSFSSRGPMYDGRIIPQLAIEGEGGTSNAAPKITGIMGMLAQFYKTKTVGTEAPASLLRASLMNTADDLDNPGPDFKSGWGRANVRRAYQLINAGQYLSSSVGHGATNSHSITVPANTKQLRVMIVWPDVAAAVNADPAIVNDLNIVAKSPSAISYNTWVLDHSPSLASISAPATKGRDSINTTEQVVVDNPAAGSWTVEVNGYNVPSGPQTYYLVYEFLGDELSMAFPLENQRLISGEIYKLRWDSYGSTGTFSLAYELNGSGIWTNIVSGYDTAARVFSWPAPGGLTGIQTIKFRVKRGSLTAYSGVNYIGAIPTNFRVFSSCTDTVTLKWSSVPGADSYRVYKLGAQYMEQVTSGITFTGTTSARLTGQNGSINEYYAVSAVTGTNEGSRTMTITRAPGDIGCGGILWTGATSTDWFDASNWASGTVPTPADNVIIPSAPVNQPNISGGIATANRITINSGAILSMGTGTDSLRVYGDWINNGSFNRGTATVDFVGTGGYQELGGSATTNFHYLKITTGSRDRIVEATALISLNATTNPLNIFSGTFKLSSASTITPFHDGTAANLGTGKGLWNNGGTINSGNFSWGLNSGLLRSSAGTINIGTNSNNIINYLNNGIFTIEGGNVNIAGRYSPNSGVSTTTFTQSGGTLTVNTVGSTSTTAAPFQINASGTFMMSGGTIVIRNASSNAADYINLSSTATVTGGTIQIGNSTTSAAQTIRINSTVPVYNLTVNATNSPTAQLVTNGISISNNLSVNGGTFNSNGLAVNIGGNISNAGTISGGLSTYTANGPEAQTINTNSDLVVNQFVLNNASGLTLAGSADLQVNGTLDLQSGVLHTGSNKVVLGDNAVVSGYNASKYIDGTCRKIGNDAFEFPIGSGSVYAPISISAPSLVTDHFTASYFPTNPDPTYSISSTVAPLSSVRPTEYWILNRTGGASSVAVTLSWSAARSGTISSLTDLLVARWNGTNWVSEGAASTSGTGSAGTIVSNTVSSFSPFAIGSSAAATPLSLLHFAAAAQGDQVLVDWKTAAETEKAQYKVERSKDGNSWEQVALIEGRNPGNTPQEYQCIDSKPYAGKSYYRLQQLEISGNTYYSPTAVVFRNNNKAEDIVIYPNPTGNMLYVRGNATVHTIEIYNSNGVLVLTSNYTNGVNVNGLAAGNYRVKIEYGDHQTITQALQISK